MDTQLVEQGKKQAKNSLVFGILALVLFPLSELFFVFMLINAIKSKNRNEGKMPGKAVAGLICAIAGVAIFATVVFVGAVTPSFVKYADTAKEKKMESSENEIEIVLRTNLAMIPTMDSDFVPPADGEYSLEDYLLEGGPAFADAFYETLGISDVSELGYSSITVKVVGLNNLTVTVKE